MLHRSPLWHIARLPPGARPRLLRPRRGRMAVIYPQQAGISPPSEANPRVCIGWFRYRGQPSSAKALRISLQGFYDWSIGRWKLVLLQFRRIDPSDFGAIERRCPPFSDGATKKMQLDGFFRILVPDDLKGNRNLDTDAQLFVEFPLQAFFQTFSLFAFPAWKFPQTGEMHACAAFGDEITSVNAD